ncbi:MAG TPA: ABC transporter substrate-binding protein [Alphaproteobacteria bacterium]|jgi:peptide/nickel transport system substrate-binding protein|nr:ABC transporter substrate-binding protein [Alphaproteobacteria bacterium]MDP6270621.1 ABC transporter substrate-binding protein [Alphaproteobacteria bacterium]HJM51366.1 ABC transporter substrate-binding protein [Alphaproteobacteria bacterium]
MKTKRILTAAIAGAAMALVLAGPASAAEPKQGGTLTFIYRIIGGHFNPAIASGTPTGIPGTQLFAALLRFDAQWNPQPYLAESWKIADDGLSVRVNLRKNAVFHDGHPITSEDVAFSIATYQKNHPFKPMYAPVTKVDTPDPHTAILRLSKPHPAILLAMSSQLGVVIPKHVYGKTDNIRKHPQNSQNIVGSGAFKLKEFKPGEHIILERFDKYFLKGRPYVDRIVYKKMAESTSRIIALEKGKADFTAFAADAQELTRYKKSKHLSLTPNGYSAIGPLNWLAFNTARKPFDDKRVRQAFAYALDKKFLLKVLYQGFAQRATGPIHPGSVFYSADVNHYNYDLDKAKALLDAAGYKPDAYGVRIKTTLDFIPGGALWKRWAELTKAQLKKAGIAVTIKASSDFRAWLKTVTSHNFDMTLDSVFNWGDPVIGVHRTYQSSNIRKGVPWHNTQQFRNDAIDAIMEKAGKELDLGKRKALYAEMQKMIVDEAPIAYINASPYHTVYNNERVGNPPINSIWGTSAPWDETYIKQ